MTIEDTLIEHAPKLKHLNCIRINVFSDSSGKIQLLDSNDEIIVEEYFNGHQNIAKHIESVFTKRYPELIA
jgi:hypothetical protein